VNDAEITTLEALLDRLASVGDEGDRDEKPDSAAGVHPADDEPVTLEAMLDAVGRRSFGPLLLMAGLVIVAPIVGDIPTVPTMMAFVIFLVAVQLLARREEFWLPGWLLRRSVKRKRVRKAVEGLRRPTRWVDKLLRRRMTVLTGTTGSMVIAGTCLVLALAIPPMELVPFTATVAGVAVSGFGLALIAEDGLVALISFIVTTGGLAWALWMVL
jgi:hypothetical protein